MKIFISHSSKDSDIAKTLATFLESVDCTIEVFCSSQSGSIKVGQDFIDVITKELIGCTTFIPLLSKNYYTSKFCMIELGFAYAILSKKQQNELNYIFPISVPPIKKSEALKDTPLERIQVGHINDINDIRSYINNIFERENFLIGSGLNKRVHSFIVDINKILTNANGLVSTSSEPIKPLDNSPNTFAQFDNNKNNQINSSQRSVANDCEKLIDLLRISQKQLQIFRSAFNSGEQDNINSVVHILSETMQSVFNLAEVISPLDSKKSLIRNTAMDIVEIYNKFVSIYMSLAHKVNINDTNEHSAEIDILLCQFNNAFNKTMTLITEKIWILTQHNSYFFVRLPCILHCLPSR